MAIVAEKTAGSRLSVEPQLQEQGSSFAIIVRDQVKASCRCEGHAFEFAFCSTGQAVAGDQVDHKAFPQQRIGLIHCLSRVVRQFHPVDRLAPGLEKRFVVPFENGDRAVTEKDNR